MNGAFPVSVPGLPVRRSPVHPLYLQLPAPDLEKTAKRTRSRQEPQTETQPFVENEKGIIWQ